MEKTYSYSIHDLEQSLNSIETLSLSQIETQGGTQIREELNQDAIEEYATQMQEGVVFPPVQVYYDGEKYWLADGFHRVHAAQKAGLEEIGVQIHNGSLREAILHALGANACHGLRRTNADKRRAVNRMLEDEEWSRWSDREIACRVGVSNRFVSNLRSETTVNGSQSTLRRGADGRVINIANIGKSTSKPTDDIEETLEEQDNYQDDEEPEELEELPQPEGQKANHQLINTSVSNEWYTPKPFLEAAREVMGVIDLDPASNFFANQTVNKDVAKHSVNGIEVEQRISDGFINGTAMCVAHGKKINDWFRNIETIEFIEALAQDLGYEIKGGNSRLLGAARVSAAYPNLVISKKGSPATGGGVWIHPDLAIQLAQKCNPPFAIQVSRWVREWIVILEQQRRAEEEKQQSYKAIKACVLPTPRQWSKMFPDEFWQKLEHVTGRPQHSTSWLVSHIYARFPREVHKL